MNAPIIPTGTPIPIRFEAEDEIMLRRLKDLTGISMSNLIRRSCKYAAPRFLDGRINLLTLKEEHRAIPLLREGDK